MKGLFEPQQKQLCQICQKKSLNRQNCLRFTYNFAMKLVISSCHPNKVWMKCKVCIWSLVELNVNGAPFSLCQQ